MAQVTHVLDTSALLAHAFQEPGWERVREILRDEEAVLGLSAAVLFEFQVRLLEKGVLDRHPDTAAEYEALFDVAIPVDNVVARAAFQLTRHSPTPPSRGCLDRRLRQDSRCRPGPSRSAYRPDPGPPAKTGSHVAEDLLKPELRTSKLRS